MASNKEIKALITLAGKVDPSLQTALLKTTGETNKLKNTLKKTGSIAGGVFKGVLGAQIVGKAANALFSAGKQAVQLASDLQEVQNVVDVTFGKDATQIDKWAKEALTGFGLSELEAKRFSGTMGAMLKSSGLTGDSVVKLSKDLTNLTGDMASFYNLDAETAFEKIRSGISGETEPLKQLGINMSVANLEAYALSKGIKTSYSSMDQASQTLLRYSYLMDMTKDAQGDFARTSDSFANQQKLLKESFKQTSAQLMSGVVPVLAKGMGFINGFLSKIDASAAGEKISGVLSIIMEKAQPVFSLVEAALPLIQKIAPIVGDIAYIVGTVLGKAIEYIVPVIRGLMELLTPVIEGIGFVTSKIKGLIGGGATDKTPAIPMQLYAEGGLATRPSIFGEAGPEMAIPIRPGDSRSIGLLSQTARMLGVGTGEPSITISMPITVYVSGGDSGSIRQAIGQAGAEMEEQITEILDRYFARKARVSYA